MGENGPPRTFLPMALAVDGCACLVVGGGAIGSRKVRTLCHFGGIVTVVAPAVSAAVTELVELGAVRWLPEAFRNEHLAGAALVVAATDQDHVNATVVAAARSLHIPVCDASSAARSDFIFGALLEGAEERIAVFTDGHRPGHARAVRDRLRSQIGSMDAVLIGRLTAAAAHELRNVLAIVRESAGLIADLTRCRAPTATPDQDGTLRAADRIDAQVLRAADLLRALSRLAHGPEDGPAERALGAQVREAVLLCRRLADQRRCSLEAEVAEPDVAVHTTVVDLVGLVLALLEDALSVAPEGSVIRLCTGCTSDVPELHCRLQPPPGAATYPIPVQRVRPWLDALDARCDGTAGPGEIAVRFTSRARAASGQPAAGAPATGRAG